MHAVDFFKTSGKEIPPVVVLTGGQRYLKNAAIAFLKKQVIDDDETSLTKFSGETAELHAVRDELLTISMWGDHRLVIVEEADDFVSKFRAGLEKLVEKPARKSVLVLDVGTWTKTTRLYKQIQTKGLEIECSELKGSQLLKWVQETMNEQYGQTISRDAAALLVESVGEELGLLNSELAKLASYVGAAGNIGVGDVKAIVGGWRMETTWAMTDSTRDDNVAFAIKALDQLLMAGEPTLKLLGGITYTFRKFAQATESSRTMQLDQALRQAGVFPMAVAPGQSYLRRIGRAKAERILEKLLETDAGIKGANPLPERFQLERLLLELAGRLS